MNFFLISTLLLSLTCFGQSESNENIEVLIKGVEIDSIPKAVLTKILKESKIKSARVSSYIRNELEQSEIMYDLIKNESALLTTKRYRYGDPLVLTYILMMNDKKSSTLPEMENTLKKIIQYLGPKREAFMHVGVTDNYTFDIAPSSIVGKKEDFIKAVKNNPKIIQERFFIPGYAEKAFHLEVKKE